MTRHFIRTPLIDVFPPSLYFCHLLRTEILHPAKDLFQLALVGVGENDFQERIKTDLPVLRGGDNFDEFAQVRVFLNLAKQFMQTYFTLEFDVEVFKDGLNVEK